MSLISKLPVVVRKNAAEDVERFVEEAMTGGYRFGPISSEQLERLLCAMAGLDGDARSISSDDYDSMNWQGAASWDDAIRIVQKKSDQVAAANDFVDGMANLPVEVNKDATEAIERFVKKAITGGYRFGPISSEQLERLLCAMAGLDGDANDVSSADNNALNWRGASSWESAIRIVQTKADQAARANGSLDTIV